MYIPLYTDRRTKTIPIVVWCTQTSRPDTENGVRPPDGTLTHKRKGSRDGTLTDP